MRNLFKKCSIALIIVLSIMVFGITNVNAEEMINEVTVTGLKKPNVGDSVADNIASISIPENANYTATEIIWWEDDNFDGIYGPVEDVFKEDCFYRYEVLLTANDGFAFEKGEEEYSFGGNVSTSDMSFEMAQLNNDSTLSILGDTMFFQANDTATYKVIEGANQTYIINDSSEARFRIDAKYQYFNGYVYVDGEEISWENYDSEEGSTIITLKKEYVDTLSEGQHTLKVGFLNDKFAETTFTITREKATSNTEITPPNTGIDDLASNNTRYVSILVLSILMLGGYLINKKRFN